MRIGLVAPLGEDCNINPGSHMITSGIRYLVRQAIPEAVFLPIEMRRDDDSWKAAPLCDALILCGNPRFSMSEPSFWECDIWPKLMGLQNLGIRIIDGWSGATHGHAPGATVEEMSTALLDFPRTAQYMEFALRADGWITRDPVMQHMYRSLGAESVLLPCSSWWAQREYSFHPQTFTGGSLVTVLGQVGNDQMAEAVRHAIGALHGFGAVRVIASVWNDYAHMIEADIESELVPDPESLLRLYAGADRVIAFRLHSAIPAASVGCAVCLVALDSRALAVQPFGIPTVGIDEIGSVPFAFSYAVHPNEAACVQTLRAMLRKD